MSSEVPDDTTTFRDLGVSSAICDALEEKGISTPFPIQEMTLPLALTGADIIGQARTGTGKTLGFGVPMLQRIDPDKSLQVLIIVPTRELCLQVSEDLAHAGSKLGIKVTAVYGGKAIDPQIKAIEEGAQLVVGTPGRLLDLQSRRVLLLDQVTGVVLDEADEMLDMGFLPDVERLIGNTSKDRQTLLFSATMPSAIVSLARRYMIKPTFMRAEVEEVTTVTPQIQQYFFSCHRMDKPAVLARILEAPDRGLCVVFCRTKRMADRLAEDLQGLGIPAQAMHSDRRQEARERVLKKFRDGKVTVLCATEVAARGLDIEDVTHVVNYDCPDDEKMYLHRIGRTGRAGADGVAITFAVWTEMARLDMIKRELGIEDETHEVFSTSSLLDKLFDLPPREEKEKTPSTPRSSTSSNRNRSTREKRQQSAVAKPNGGPAELRPPRRRHRDGQADDQRSDQGTQNSQDGAVSSDASTSDTSVEPSRGRNASRRRKTRDRQADQRTSPGSKRDGTSKSSGRSSDASAPEKTKDDTATKSAPNEESKDSGVSPALRRRRGEGKPSLRRRLNVEYLP